MHSLNRSLPMMGNFHLRKTYLHHLSRNRIILFPLAFAQMNKQKPREGKVIANCFVGTNNCMVLDTMLSEPALSNRNVMEAAKRATRVLYIFY